MEKSRRKAFSIILTTAESKHTPKACTRNVNNKHTCLLEIATSTMILLHSPSVHVVDSVKRKKEKCFWYELTFTDVEKKFRSKRFANFMTVENIEDDNDDASMNSDDDDATIASSVCEERTVVSMLSRSNHKTKKSRKSKTKESRGVLRSKSSSSDRPSLDDQLSKISMQPNPSPLLCGSSHEPYSSEGTGLLKGVAIPLPPPVPPTDVNTPPPTRLSFLNKQRSWRAGTLGAKARGRKYVVRKEINKHNAESNARRSTVKSALYACMEEDDEEDYLDTFLKPKPNITVFPAA